MRRPFSLKLTLYMQTPLSSGAAGASSFVADRIAVRNGLGEFIIPGSQVRGNVRHACERLLRAVGAADRICYGPRPDHMCPHAPSASIRTIDDPYSPGQTLRCCILCSLFGSAYFTSPLHFHDLVCRNPFRQPNQPPYTSQRDARLGDETLRTMVSLNRQRRVAQERRLFVVETAPAQPQLAFSHDEAISGTLDTEAQAQLLLAGLNLLTAIGGGRSRGLGWIQSEAEATLDGQPVRLRDGEGLRQLWLS
jgi:CRISPR/Cas system CSM-associated protein Csm3 (group 7 of RAMP superfamily)